MAENPHLEHMENLESKDASHCYSCYLQDIDIGFQHDQVLSCSIFREFANFAFRSDFTAIVKHPNVRLTGKRNAFWVTVVRARITASSAIKLTEPTWHQIQIYNLNTRRSKALRYIHRLVLKQLICNSHPMDSRFRSFVLELCP